MKPRDLDRDEERLDRLAREVDGRENPLERHGRSGPGQLAIRLLGRNAGEGDQRLPPVRVLYLHRLVARLLGPLEPDARGVLDDPGRAVLGLVADDDLDAL